MRSHANSPKRIRDSSDCAEHVFDGTPTKRYKTSGKENEPLACPNVIPGGGHPVKRHPNQCLFVLDWDDTLFPSSFLTRLGYEFGERSAVAPILESKLRILEDEVLSLLETAFMMVGSENVVIITNAEKGWVELSGQLMPRVLERIQKCYVVSARTTFEEHVPNYGPFEWKVLAFHLMAEIIYGARLPQPIVNVMRQTVNRELYQAQESTYPDNEPVDHGEEDDNNSTDKENAIPNTTDERNEEWDCEDPKKRDKSRVSIADETEDQYQSTSEELDLKQDSDTSTEDYPYEREQDDVNPPEGIEALSDLPVLANQHESGCSQSGTDPSLTFSSQEEGEDEENEEDDEDAHDNEGQDEFGLSDSAAGNNTEGGGGAAMYSPSNEVLQFPQIPDCVLRSHNLQFQAKVPYSVLRNQEKIMVSIGDSLAEKLAAQLVTKEIPNTVLKTIKLIDRPNLEQLTTEVKLIRENIEHYLNQPGSLDVQVELPYYDMTEFEQGYYKQRDELARGSVWSAWDY